MKRIAAMIASAVVLGSLGCSSPDIDGKPWKCSAQDECGAGYSCHIPTGVCQPTGTTSPVVHGVSDEKIVLGMSAALTSGTATDLGQGMKAGIEAYFHQVNQSGGVNNRMLELVALDDGYDPGAALENMQTMLDGNNRQVFAILGNVGTPTAAVTLPYANEKSVLFFGAYTGASLLRNDPPDKYVYNYRASYREETEQIVAWMVGVREPRIQGNHVAVFAQGEESGALDAYGESGFMGVASALKTFGSISESKDIPLATYPRGTDKVDAGVKTLLQAYGNMGCAQDGACNDDPPPATCSNPFDAALVLVPTYSAAAAAIQAINKAVGSAKLGDTLASYGLTPKQLFGLRCIRNVEYASVSFVGAESLMNDLNTASPYSTKESGGSVSKLHCENVIVSQVVPHYDSESEGVIEYRTHLAEFDPNLRPGFISLEGYLVARLFVEGLRKHGGGDLEMDPFVTTLSTLEAELGVGTTLRFTANDHQASHKVWLTQLTSEDGKTCNYEALPFNR